jgi:hypothetical protein
MEGEGNPASTSKPPAKSKHCVFRLINILFSDKIAPKLSRLGHRKDRLVLDSGLAGGDEHFWQEVAAENMEGDEEEYSRLSVEEHPIFSDINPSKKVNHTWSKLRDIWKTLLKNYNDVHENWKQSGNHDDFLNFCNGKSDVYYLFLRLQQKPMLTNMVTNYLPESIFFDSNNKIHHRRPLPTFSEYSTSRTSKANLADSVSKWVALKSDQSSTELSKAKLKAVNSKNLDDTINRLIETKQRYNNETDPDVKRILKWNRKTLEKTMADLAPVLPDSSSSDSSV